jgi:hypothetical protein
MDVEVLFVAALLMMVRMPTRSEARHRARRD